MENIIKRVANLLSVKSLVTIVLTGVFAFLAIKGEINQSFMVIYTTVIAFYFGSQSQKISDAISGEDKTEKKTEEE